MDDIQKIQIGRLLIAEAAIYFLVGNSAPHGWAEKADALMRVTIDPALMLTRIDELLGETCEHLAECESSPNCTWYRRLFEMDGSHMALCAGVDDGLIWIPASEVESARENADPEAFLVVEEVNKPATDPADSSDTPKFLILSAVHSKRSDHALWWRPEGKGYAIDLKQAGRFSESAAQESVRGSHGDNVVIFESDMDAIETWQVIDMPAMNRHLKARKGGQS